MKNPICAAMVAIVLALMSVNIARAQTFTVLHYFSSASNPNYDGSGPAAGLVMSGNTLYGVARGGGSSGMGTVFKVNTDGTGFTILYNFSKEPGVPPSNTDGVNPIALTVSGNILYGMANGGGSSGAGTVFRLNTDGTGFTNLHNFTGIDGSEPDTGNGLVVSGNTLYGTTPVGGNLGSGTVFKLNTDGTGFTNLHKFNGSGDGANLYCTLVLCSNVLYGTANSGGSSNYGTVFSLNTDGTGFTNLHNFTGGSDGGEPSAGLIISGGTLYGTTYVGGNSDDTGGGTVFAINTDGSGITNLHVFSGGSGFGGTDGGASMAPLFLCGSTLYGTSLNGGTNHTGALFAVNTNGTGFTVLHNLAPCPDYGPQAHINTDGINPDTGVIVSGAALYGTTQAAGITYGGTLFSTSFAPQLSMAVSGTSLIFSWPTNVPGFDYSGFTLQCSTNPAAPGSWLPVPLTPACVNDQYVATNSISGTQMFYRLIR